MRPLIAFFVALSFATTASAEVPASLEYGLDFCFRQDDGGELTLLDSARGNDIKAVGKVSTAFDLGRQVRRYPGGANYFGHTQTSAALSMRNSSDWTVAALVKPAAIDTNYAIYSSGVDTGVNHAFLYSSTAGDCKFSWKNATDHLTLTVPGVVVGEWMLVVVWFDATTNTVGMSLNDGTPDTETATGVTDPLGKARIGSDLPGYANYFKGDMATVAKWSRLLTPAERTALYDNGRFSDLNPKRVRPPLLAVERDSLSDPIAATSYSLKADSRNHEHQLINSRTVKESNDLYNGNVVSLWHKSVDGGNSAMRFLKPGPIGNLERGAIGRGSQWPFDALFIEASNLDTTESPPEEFRFVQTGRINGTYLNYLRMSIRADGSYNWLALDGTTSQFRIDLPGNVIVGGTVATDATDGFFRIPSCAGVPTGAAADGSMVRDSTNHKVYFRSGGNWIALN